MCVNHETMYRIEKVAKFVPYEDDDDDDDEARICSRADECALLASRYFLPNSCERPSIAIHFRGSNYFYGVLKSNRRRKLRALLKLRKSLHGNPRRFTLPLTPRTVNKIVLHPYKVSSNLSSGNLFRSRNIFSFIPIFFSFYIHIYIYISFSPLIVYSLRICLHLSPTRSINSIRWGDNEAIDGSKRFLASFVG